MKLKVLAVALASCVCTQAQEVKSFSSFLRPFPKSDVVVPFRTSDEGKKTPIKWGFDTAWLSSANVRRGVTWIGRDNVEIIRVSYRPSHEIVNDALNNDQINYINRRANIVKNYCKPGVEININDDHGVVADWYNPSSQEDRVARWTKVIELHARKYRELGLNLVSISPYNEPDLISNNQGSNNENTRMQDFKKICQLLRTNPEWDNVRMVGGNTLNPDRALPWWSVVKDVVEEGNTHQLAGTFDNYAKYFTTVQKAGKLACNDELHNTMEAMVGVEYGMQTGIWWGSANTARGEFMKATLYANRLGYGEHRPNWTSAAVYRHPNGFMQGFVGSSERQAVSTTFGLRCLDTPIWVNGEGPFYEYPFFIHGGTGYQVGQTNAEAVCNIQAGEDIQPLIEDGGAYSLYNPASGKYLVLPSGAGNTTPLTKTTTPYAWYMEKVPITVFGDFSGYFIYSGPDRKRLIDLNNSGLNAGTNIIAYPGGKGEIEQWYLRYEGNGCFRILCCYSGMCIDAGNANNSTVNMQMYDANKPSQLWRLVKGGGAVPAKTVAPTDFAVKPQTGSVRLDWTSAANGEETYPEVDIQRSEDGEKWTTIVKALSANAFIDNTAVVGKIYTYRIATRHLGDILSDWVTSEKCSVLDGKNLIMHLTMDENTNDTTENGNHLLYVGTPKYEDGIVGKCLKMDANSYGTLPHSLADFDEVTFTTWTNWNNRNDQRIFEFANNEDQRVFLSPYYNSSLSAVFKNGSDEYVVTYSGGKMPTKKWIHLAVTVGHNGIKLYLNGELIGENTEANVSLSDIHPMFNFIGRDINGTLGGYTGSLDETSLYNYVLTPEEIKSLYDKTTDVRQLQVEGSVGEGSSVYNLSGMKVSSDSRGILIQDGKKVIK